jgi:hypothetical protein
MKGSAKAVSLVASVRTVTKVAKSYDVSKPAVTAMVNTHVDDLEGNSLPELRVPIQRALEAVYGTLKMQERAYKHVGIDYAQTKALDVLRWSQRRFGELLKYHPIPKTRRQDSAEALLPTEQTDFRSSVSGSSWYGKARPDLTGEIHELQTHFGNATILDMIRANALVRLIHDTLNIDLLFKRLPAGPVRVVMYPDASKGDLIGSVKPVIGFVAVLCPQNENSYDGPGQTWDWKGGKSTRVSKSSMHSEGIALATSIERGEKICGILEEIYFPLQTTAELLVRQETGTYRTPLEAVTDSKSLFDIVLGDSEPRPNDEGSLLWVKWSRERLQSGAVQALAWCSTQDELGDPMTKAGCDRGPLLRLTFEGYIKFKYSCLRNGRILDTAKGLPVPKSQRDAVSQQFCRLYWESEMKLGEFFQALHQKGFRNLLGSSEILASTEEEMYPEDTRILK